ncbi:AbrB/MazE/SpoVT family DNA-binding domain-containing protein [Castellaniella sp.]|uniref:AbrB/MazE/SpoVT family DNA-binding domain-containing protein n=1 Tax=Castellaniella sp. TaxID=1955812 RepID=UPI003C78B510
MMMTGISTLSSRGQLTIPKIIRDQLGLKPGDNIGCSLLPDGTLILRPKVHHIEDLVGILRRPSQPRVPIEEMRVELPDAGM